MHQVDVVDRALVSASSSLAVFVICHFGHVIATRLFAYLICPQHMLCFLPCHKVHYNSKTFNFTAKL